MGHNPVDAWQPRYTLTPAQRRCSLRQIEADALPCLKGDDLVLITQRGKASGIFVPLEAPDRLPDDLRRSLMSVVGRYLAASLEATGVSEANLLEDFADFRRSRR